MAGGSTAQRWQRKRKEMKKKLFELYFKWFAKQTFLSTSPNVFQRFSNDITKGEWMCTLDLYGTKRKFNVSLSMDRALYSDLGLSPPINWIESEFTLNERQKQDKKAVRDNERLNKERIQFKCPQLISAKNSISVVIPSSSLQDLTGELSFQFETAVGIGGTIFFKDCPIGVGDIGKVEEAIARNERSFERWRENNPEWVRFSEKYHKQTT